MTGTNDHGIRLKRAIIGIAITFGAAFLLNCLVPIPLPPGGRPASTDVRVTSDGLDVAPYVVAAEMVVRNHQESHGLEKRHWDKPKIVADRGDR